MRRNVLFVINSLAGGGAERVMATLLQGSMTRARDHDIALALLDEDVEAYAVPDWVKVHRLDCGHSLARSVARLRALVRRERPDAVLSFLTRANVAAAWATGGRGWVASERVDTSAHLATGRLALVSRTLVRLAYARARRIIAVSDGVAEGLSRDFAIDPARIDVIPNPVDLAAIRVHAAEAREIAVEPPYVMAIGRLVENKNVTMLIDAFARSGIPGRLVVAGEGPERAALVAQAARLGIAERVVLPGFLANPHALLARAICYVSASTAEGFPNALVEAMAAGVAVLSTNCASGPSEILAGRPRTALQGVIVTDRGILVPVDDADAMADGLRLMQSPERRAAMIAAAGERVAEYSVERAVARYWSVIDAVLAERRG